MQNQIAIQSKARLPADRHLFVWDNPGRVIDRNSRPVDTTQDIWQIQEPLNNVDINWNLLHVASDIKDAIKCYVAHIIESHAPVTAHQAFQQLKYCFVRLPAFNSAWDITYEHVESAVAQVRIPQKEWHFHYVRRWYRWCEDQGIPGFSGEIASRLYRLKIKNNTHGEKVMTRDVNDGPLSHDEHFLIRKAVKEGCGSLKSRVIIMLLMELGARPVQLLQIEEQDLIVNTTDSGQPFYSLCVPRAKQRTIGEPEKKRRRISPELGQLLEHLIEENHLVHGNQGRHMPILCISKKSYKKLTEELKPKYSLHMKVIGFAQRVQGFATAANIISPRTQKFINLTPRRLRYTYFTMLAEQGTSTNHLAELADHSTDKSIIIYVSSTSSVVDRLNAALGKDKRYADIINRFLGELLHRTGDEDPASVISGSTPTLKNLGGIGVCGANFLCDLFPPLSCYICPKFQAWIDGPHKELLLEIEAYANQLIEASGNPSDRIPHQLADVMVSIRQLLYRIEEMKDGV